jgi:hypothetical protein
MHDLLRDYSVEQAQSADRDGARREALSRLLGYYVQSGYAMAVQLNPARDAPSLPLPALPPGVCPADLADYTQALAWYDAEYRTLLACVELAARTGFDTHAWLLCWVLSDFLERQGRWQDWLRAQRTAAASAARL